MPNLFKFYLCKWKFEIFLCIVCAILMYINIGICIYSSPLDAYNVEHNFQMAFSVDGINCQYSFCTNYFILKVWQHNADFLKGCFKKLLVRCKFETKNKLPMSIKCVLQHFRISWKRDSIFCNAKRGNKHIMKWNFVHII